MAPAYLQNVLTFQRFLININLYFSLTFKYFPPRWHSLPSPKDLALMALSSGACELLLFLKDRLKKLERQLARTLFSTLWQRLAQELNNVIYKEVTYIPGTNMPHAVCGLYSILPRGIN